jgi:prepilin-type N-terminal cleavage/methylation domain-containing protein
MQRQLRAIWMFHSDLPVTGGRHVRAIGTRQGFTLLEVLVALVIVSMVVVGYLQLFHGGHELVIRSREWSAAVAYAVDGMEQAKRESAELRGERTEALPGGFQRQITSRPWRPGLALITVMVVLPAGGHFDLYRLQESGAALGRQTAPGMGSGSANGATQ